MRSHEGNEAQVCYFIIQLLLLKPNDFRNRVSDFVKENAPEHWLQSDWHTKHMSYHKVNLANIWLTFCHSITFSAGAIWRSECYHELPLPSTPHANTTTGWSYPAHQTQDLPQIAISHRVSLPNKANTIPNVGLSQQTVYWIYHKLPLPNAPITNTTTGWSYPTHQIWDIPQVTLTQHTKDEIYHKLPLPSTTNSCPITSCPYPTHQILKLPLGDLTKHTKWEFCHKVTLPNPPKRMSNHKLSLTNR